MTAPSHRNVNVDGIQLDAVQKLLPVLSGDYPYVTGWLCTSPTKLRFACFIHFIATRQRKEPASTEHIRYSRVLCHPCLISNSLEPKGIETLRRRTECSGEATLSKPHTCIQFATIDYSKKDIQALQRSQPPKKKSNSAANFAFSSLSLARALLQ